MSRRILVAVLLAYGSLRGEEETARGLALKSLNAALSALDLAQEKGGLGFREELESWSDRLLGIVADPEGGR